MIKLTQSLKKKITKQWRDEFPNLAVYKNMWLLRRIGPLLQGISLDKDSSNSNYLPIFHIHNLVGQVDDFISLSLRTPLLNSRKKSPEHISIAQHEQNFDEIIERFRSQLPFALEGEVYCNNILQAYEYYIQLGGEETKYPLIQYYDMICILIWCERLEEASDLFINTSKKISKWPKSVTQYFGSWKEKFYLLEGYLTDVDSIKVNVITSLTILNMDELPNNNILP